MAAWKAELPPYPTGNFKILNQGDTVRDCVYEGDGSGPGTLSCPFFQGKAKCLDDKERTVKTADWACNREKYGIPASIERLSFHRVVSGEY